MREELNHLVLGGIALSATLGVTMTNSYATTNLNQEMTRNTKTGTVLTNALNVRSGPSTSYSSLGKVNKGYTFKILSETNGWYKLSYNNKTAYVSANPNYVKCTTDSISKTFGTATANLNLRSGPSTSYKKLGQISNGTKVEIVKKENSAWYKIKHKNSYAYVSSQYIKLGSNDKNNDNSSNSGNNNSSVIKTGVTKDTLNVRKGSSTSYSILGKLAKGSKVNIVEKTSNGWYKIKYNNGYGYVSADYVKASSTGSGSDNTTSSPSIKKGKVTATVNVRSGNSTSHQILGKLSNGASVSIVERTYNNWYKIKFNSGFGYVSGDHVKASLDKFLFVGDSYTYLLGNTIKANASSTIIIAKSGCAPSYWLNNFSQMPSSSSVEGISLLLGVNGMNASQYNRTVSDMKTLIKKLVNKYPNKTIYVQKVFPLGRNFSKATLNRIINYNASIKSYCNNFTNVKFIDTTAGLVTNDGYLKYPDSEGIHVIPAKYQTFYNNINNAILNTY